MMELQFKVLSARKTAADCCFIKQTTIDNQSFKFKIQNLKLTNPGVWHISLLRVYQV